MMMFLLVFVLVSMCFLKLMIRELLFVELLGMLILFKFLEL